MTEYKIVQVVDGQLTVDKTDDVEAWAAMRGIEITGYNANPRNRAELQGQPILATFCGPMWDGGPIRYESPEANDILSA
jgi:hypothetical protein